MNEALLLRAALIIAALGLGGLLMLTNLTDVKEINIGEAKQAEEGTSLIIKGVVSRVVANNDFTIITIQKEEEIDAMLFDSINLSKGQRVEVTGKIKDYNGEKEVVADKIVVK